MATQPTCERCGTPLSAFSPPGLCPRCLLHAGLGVGPEQFTTPGSRSVSEGSASPPQEKPGNSQDTLLVEVGADGDRPRSDPAATSAGGEGAGARIGPYKLLQCI